VVLGDQPFLWKLWLFPFELLLAGSVWALARRYARGLEIPLVALILFSPAFLPALNLMQDVPAVALGLTALVLYLAAADRDSWQLSLAAGLVAGLAVQTKYPAVVVLGVVLAHGLLYRRLRRAVPVVVLALVLFFAWEGAMTALYGQGMFFGQVRHGLFWVPRGLMVESLVRLLGGTLPVVSVLGLVAPRRPPWVAWVACGAVAVGFAWLIGAPVERPLFLALGAAVVLSIGVAVTRGVCPGRAHRPAWPPWERRRVDWLLLLWLLGEVGIFFLASPFPAVRRVMGIVVVGSLLIARRAAAVRRRNAAAVPVGWIVACGVALGGLYAFVDFREARAQRDAVPAALEAIHEADADPTVWFVGHWGFQHYAESAGLLPVVPDGSLLRSGDWLLAPDPVDRQEVALDAGEIALHGTVRSASGPPLRTGYGYYGGDSPLSHVSGPRLETRVYRVIRDVVPPTGWPVRRTATWAIEAGGRTAAAALPALIRHLRDPDPGARLIAMRGIAALGESGAGAREELTLLLDDPSAAVREAASETLERIGR
jgi:hypothetical protein